MAQLPIPIQPTTHKADSGNSHKTGNVVIVIANEETVSSLTSWLDHKPDLHQSNIVLVHITQPQWLSKTPYSGAGGSQMLQHLQKQILRMSGVMEGYVSTINEKFPSINVEYRIKTGDPLSQLIQLAKSIKADYMFVFGNDKVTNPGLSLLGENSLKALSAKCPCPVEIISNC
jgi:hypothetical protein